MQFWGLVSSDLLLTFSDFNDSMEMAFTGSTCKISDIKSDRVLTRYPHSRTIQKNIL
jgi:hypothetical protein